jgi:2-amino-4-hydroxy-6-hydroxymethyldihydropteridine diphosphokinase
MARAFVAVGSNIRPEENVRAALQRLAERGPLRVSTFYRTPPWNRPEQDNFINGVVELDTALPPEALRMRLREIEAALGRVRTADRYAARTMDLDLIAYEGVESPGLPDPEIAARPFLAIPLGELWPELRLPGEARRLMEIAASLDRTGLTPLAEYTALLREEISHEP